MNAEKLTFVFYVYKALSWALCHWVFQNIVHLYYGIYKLFRAKFQALFWSICWVKIKCIHYQDGRFKELWRHHTLIRWGRLIIARIWDRKCAHDAITHIGRKSVRCAELRIKNVWGCFIIWYISHTGRKKSLGNMNYQKSRIQHAMCLKKPSKTQKRNKNTQRKALGMVVISGST